MTRKEIAEQVKQAELIIRQMIARNKELIAENNKLLGK